MIDETKLQDQLIDEISMIDHADDEVFVDMNLRTIYVQARQEGELYEEDMLDSDWIEMVRAFRNRTILTGRLSGVEETQEGYVGIVYHLGYRVVIPMKEMNIQIIKEAANYGDEKRRMLRIVNSMIGAEIDYVIFALHEDEQAAVASRRVAMETKKRHFYFPLDDGTRYITVGRRVQARVIAVAEKWMRLEVFGVDCVIKVKEVDWGWVGNIKKLYNIGDKVNVVVTALELNHETKNVYVEVSIRALKKNDLLVKMASLRKQGHYYGEITDVHNENYYVRLENGVSAVAKRYAGNRRPGKNDAVMFAVTAIDMEQFLVVGQITKVIRQNI